MTFGRFRFPWATRTASHTFAWPTSDSVMILRAITNATPDAIFVKDLEGRYVLVNTALARFAGKTPEEIVGRNDFELYPRETALKFIEADRVVLASGEARSFEDVATANNVTQAYLVTKGVYRDEHGKILGIFGISHDITERKRAEEAFGIRDAALEASRRKTEYLAHMSQEFRAPMDEIIRATTLALGADLTPEQREALATVKASAASLLTVVNSILDVEDRAVDLATVVGRVGV